MKNSKLVLMVLILVIGGVFFNSCSKDDEVKTKSLAGSVWEGEHKTFGVHSDVYDYTRKFQITFNADMKDACVINIQYADFNKNYNYIGFFDERKAYKYNYKDSTISFLDTGENIVKFRGVIKDSTISFLDTGENIVKFRGVIKNNSMELIDSYSLEVGIKLNRKN